MRQQRIARVRAAMATDGLVGRENAESSGGAGVATPLERWQVAGAKVIEEAPIEDFAALVRRVAGRWQACLPKQQGAAPMAATGTQLS